MSLVCFIAVSYFGSRELVSYVTSLLAQDDDRWVLKVVDNSVDAEEGRRLAELAEKDSRIEILSPGQNLGYFGGAEWARSRLEAGNYDWIAVTNTDVVIVATGFVATLIAMSPSETGVLAPAIFGSASNSSLNPYMRRRPTIMRSRIRRVLFWNTAAAQVTILISHLKRRYTTGPAIPEVETNIYAAHGCFMLFGRSYFVAGGSFCHSSFLFGEELTVAEFCRSRKLNTIYTPSLRVVHIEHANTGLLRSRSVLLSQVAAAKNALDLISAKK